MEKKVFQFIEKYGLFSLNQNLIVAVSGGKDSMALVYLLNKSDFKIIVAHCNFTLRGNESDEDAKFIKNYCAKNNILYNEIVFETEKIAKQKSLSIQETARELRYSWLEKIRKENNAVGIATAHHLDDNIETVLFKIAKGTGVRGIRGIQAKNGNIVRPFLETSVDEIRAYIAENKIEYREDNSNKSVKYDRNKIRHTLIPVLKEINTGLYPTFISHFERWNDIEKLYNNFVEHWKNKLVKEANCDKIISIKALQKVEGYETLLFEIMRDYGFNKDDVQDIIKGFDSAEHKIYLNEKNRVLIDKKFIYITAVENLSESKVHYISSKQTKIVFENGIFRLVLKPISKLSKINKGKQYAYVDADKLKFPLTLRKWKPGDYFYPYGFTKENNKPAKKKISKYLKDQRIDARSKEQTWVLFSEEKLVWLVNQRIDNRFSITEKTKRIFQIKFIEI